MRNLKKVAAIAGAVLVVLFAVVTYVALWTGSTEEIEAVADKFQPGEEWTLVSERIEPPRMVCLGGTACPSISKTWAIPDILTRGQFLMTLPTEYNIKEVTGNCPEVITDEFYTQFSCLASGSMGGHSVGISYSIDPELEDKYRLTLNVREES